MTASNVTAPLSSLTGVIERITYHSEESGYTVARLNRLTRSKKLALIVGSEKAIAIAVKQVKQQQRYTRLRERLEERNKKK
ncbi:MAG: hypothetical protein QNJ60_00165 [Xenococcaceae cyanobacterium MO_188.B19]|nr:hypothetical protein [Xenococcaceae cyanobacterium MO_188.B19]